MTREMECCFLCVEGQFIATVGYDRSIKLWFVEEDVEDDVME